MDGPPPRRGGGNRKVLLPPINFIFKMLTSKATVTIWLMEQLNMRLDGVIIGFDEHMNLVLDNAVEVRLAKGEKDEERRYIGQILLKGDNVCLIQEKQS